MPRMTHPDLPGQPIQVENETRIPVLEKSGWVVDDSDDDSDDEDDHPDPIAVPAFVETTSGLDPLDAAGVEGSTPPADAGLL